MPKLEIFMYGASAMFMCGIELKPSHDKGIIFALKIGMYSQVFHWM